MIIIPYQPNTVSHATPEFIDLRDTKGTLHHILFHECVIGWVTYITSSGDFNVDPTMPIESKCVALTHGIRHDLYIEFTWTSFVRLTFKASWRVWYPFAAFMHVRQRIHQLGWRTYDMS